VVEKSPNNPILKHEVLIDDEEDKDPCGIKETDVDQSD